MIHARQSLSDSRVGLLWLAAAVLLTILSAGSISLRFPLWVDEIYSLATAELSHGAMLRALFRVREGWYDHPPFYFMLLRSVLPFGDTPIILRIPSMFFCVATLAIWANNLHRRGLPPLIVGAWMVSMAWHPEFRFHATNARMYSLLMLETGIAFWMAEKIIASPRPRRDLVLALGLAQAALLYTSYFGAYFVGGMLLTGLLLAFKGRNPAERNSGKWILIATAGGLIAYLPWAPAALRVAALTRRATPFTFDQRVQEVGVVFSTLAGTLPVLPAMAVGWLGLSFAAKDDRRFWIWAMVLFFVAPIAVLLAMIPDTKDLPPRYLLFAAPIFSAASIVGWHALMQRARAGLKLRNTILVGLLIAYAVSGSMVARRTYLRPVPDWPGAAAIIERNALPYEIILTGGSLSGECLIYHLEDPTRFSFRHYVTRLAAFEQWCSDPAVIWFVNAAPMPEHYFAIVKRNFPYGIHFDGNRAFFPIMVYSKKPFIVPWQDEPVGPVVPTPAAPAGP